MMQKDYITSVSHSVHAGSEEIIKYAGLKIDATGKIYNQSGVPVPRSIFKFINEHSKQRTVITVHMSSSGTLEFVSCSKEQQNPVPIFERGDDDYLEKLKKWADFIRNVNNG